MAFHASWRGVSANRKIRYWKMSFFLVWRIAHDVGRIATEIVTDCVDGINCDSLAVLFNLIQCSAADNLICF